MHKKKIIKNSKKLKQGWYHDYHGAKQHFVDGEWHSINDEPAIVRYNFDSTNILFKYWFKHGKRHRESGPAIEETNVSVATDYLNIKEWYYNGKMVGASYDGFTQEDFDNWKRLKVFL